MNTITITSYNPDKPIQAIKAIRAVSGFGLRDSKAVIDSMATFDVSDYRKLNGKTAEIPLVVPFDAAAEALSEGYVAFSRPKADHGRAAALLAVSMVSQHGTDAEAILDAALGLIKDAA